jgi:hypothetical protein
MLPVGTRPPEFPDATAPRPPVPPAVERAIDDWADHTDCDVERRCRSLRRTALRHAIAHDDIDIDALIGQLAAGGEGSPRSEPPAADPRSM